MIDRKTLEVTLTLLSSSEATSRRLRDDVIKWLQRIQSSTDSRTHLADLLKSMTDEFNTSGRLENPDLSHLIEQQVDQLEQLGAGIVTIFDSFYPQYLRETLGNKAPLFLFWRGNAALFQDISVGFCGSRHASEKGLEVCGDIAQQLVQREITIAAGYAAGVDQVAHLTALRTGGKTIAVLAEGILNFSVRQLLAKEWDWSRALVVSEFLPQTRWTAPRAMQRNRTIVGLSRALVVIEAKQTGGTYEAGREALALKHPLFAPTFEDYQGNAEGNQQLIEQGAIPIMKSRTTGRAKIGTLLEYIGLSEKEDIAPRVLGL